MNNLYNIIKEHYNKYPYIQPQDILKLIYQNEFGSGHLIKDEKRSFEYLLSEWEQCESTQDEDLFDIIGNGFARMNIKVAKQQGIEPDLLHKLFVMCSLKINGTIQNYYEKTKIVMKLCDDGCLPYNYSEFQLLIDKWKNESYPTFSHSETYRNTYKPAYRIVPIKYIRLLPILIQLYNLQKQKNIKVAIDGRCGSGKTTLSQDLSEFFNAPIIHMDDFFLPPSLRTKQRQNEVGGNIHYERFLEEVISKLNSSQSFEYKVFDCSTMDYNRTKLIQSSPIIIIEGVYSLHPLFQNVYDYKIFCDIDKIEQKNRIILRNGVDGYINFENKWIPLEENYFNKFNIKNICDFIL